MQKTRKLSSRKPHSVPVPLCTKNLTASPCVHVPLCGPALIFYFFRWICCFVVIRLFLVCESDSYR